MFDPVNSPITCKSHLALIDSVAIKSSGVFRPGYFEDYGERIFGSPIPINDDMGHVVIESAAGYQIMYYQRTRFTTGVGLHNYLEPRVFRHPQSARRYAKQF